MKSFVLMTALLTVFTLASEAQVRADRKTVNSNISKQVRPNVLKEVRTIAPTFSKSEQAEIKKILGRDYVPVFSERGELSIATPSSVKHVRALGGGFSKNPGSVASNILIHSGWVLATSKDVLDAMRSKLGAQRFRQLEAIVSK